MDEKIEFFL